MPIAVTRFYADRSFRHKSIGDYWNSDFLQGRSDSLCSNPGSDNSVANNVKLVDSTLSPDSLLKCMCETYVVQHTCQACHGETDQLLGTEITRRKIASSSERLQCENGASEIGQLMENVCRKDTRHCRRNLPDLLREVYRYFL